MGVLSVSELNHIVSATLSSNPKFFTVGVRGEISGLKTHSSGHMYFSLKDENAVINCVMFYDCVKKLRFSPKDGDSVTVVGAVEIYEKNGKYQIKAREIILNALPKKQENALENLKRELLQMGVFNSENKKKLPEFPQKIAVVTSADGAVIHDIKKVLQRRFPAVKLYVFKAQVQGAAALKQLPDAIHEADKSGCDVIILARGGGAEFDFSVFNSRELAMAVYNCFTPIVSAIGHEINITLCDYAADVRAATPSEAAEICVPDREECRKQLDFIMERINYAFLRNVDGQFSLLEKISEKLENANPCVKLKQDYEECRSLADRLNNKMLKCVMRESENLNSLYARLCQTCINAVAGAGTFRILKNGEPIRNINELEYGDNILICDIYGENRPAVVCKKREV